jgi:hypothetical protein
VLSPSAPAAGRPRSAPSVPASHVGSHHGPVGWHFGSIESRHGDGPCFTFGVLALIAQRDPFPRVSVEADLLENVIGLAIAHIYAQHGVQVSRHQVLVERWPFILPPFQFDERRT